MSTEDFSPDLSDDAVAKYDSQSSIGADVMGGAVASVVDFGASVWNSLPFTENVETADLLANIDGNALRVYQENPDAVKTASFVGGVLVPSGLALKGMTAARAGMKGLNWFSEAGQIAQKTKVAEAFAAAGEASQTYKNSLYGLYAMGVGNAVADTVAAEAVMVMTMNAHPYMEDYMEDLPKNFLTSVAIGSALGGSLGHIIDRSTVKGAKIGVEQEAMKVAREGYEDVSSVENLSGQLAQRSRNVENWENILKISKSLGEEGDGTLISGPIRTIDNFTKNVLETFITKEKSEIALTFDKMASPEIRALDAEAKSNLINLIVDNPERFAGVDSIRFATAKEELPLINKSAHNLVDSTTIKPEKLGEVDSDLDIPLVAKNSKGKDVRVPLIYSQKFDAFMSAADLKYYGTASDLVKSEDALTSGLQNNWHRISRYDQSLESSRMSSAAVDADFLRTLKYYDELPIEQFTSAAIAVAPDDTSALSAIYARISKEISAGASPYDFKVTLTKELPNYGGVGSKVIERIITNNITKTIKEGGTGVIKKGVNKTALDDMTNLLRGREKDTFDLMYPKNSLSPEARALASSFSNEQMWPLQNGIEICKRKKFIPQLLMNERQAMLWGSDSYKQLRKQGLSHEEAMERVGTHTSNLGKYAEEILNSEETRLLKQRLSKHADDEGYIYLYRGMTGKAAGHSAGESYTPDYKVALNGFAGGIPGNVSLYRVHPDEIVGYLGRFKGSSSAGGEAEIVLDVPTRIVAGKSQVVTGLQDSGHTVTEVMTGQTIKEIVHEGSTKEKSLADVYGIYEQMVKNKNSEIESFLAQGVPMPTISLHTNTPLSTIEEFATSGTHDVSLLQNPMNAYTSASEIGTYLNNEQRSLAVTTNMNRVPMARIKSTLQKKIGDVIDGDVKTTMLLGSKSDVMQEIGSYLNSATTKAQLDVLRNEIDRVVQSAVDGKMFVSTDFALRDLGAAGAVITAFGKDVNELINQRVTNLWKPMKAPFTKISKDAVATVELATALKVNAGLKGYREFRNGKFFVQDENQPWKEILDSKGKVIGKERNMVEVLYKGKSFSVQTPSVIEAFDGMQVAGRELFEMRNTLNSVAGRPPIQDIGFWVPPFNPRSNNISYVIDNITGTTTLLFGKTAADLQTAENAFKSTISALDNQRGRFSIVNKGMQKEFNAAQGRHDPIFMSSADSSMLHSGSSAPEIVSTNSDVLVDLANGYDHYIGYGVRSALDQQLSDVMAKMDQLSYLSQSRAKDQPLNFIQKMIQTPKDSGAIIRNTLMGNSNLNQSVFWEKLSDVTGGAAEFGLTTINSLIEPVLNVGKSFFGRGKTASDSQFERLTADLKARGVPNPFQNMDDHLAKEVFHVQQISQAENMTPRILALSHSLVATSMLKFMELAQPIVNAISLPILTSAAMGRKLEKAYMGGVLDETARFGVIKTMYAGTRFGGSLEGKALIKEAERMNLFSPLVSEANEALSNSRKLQPGMISAVEKALDSSFVQMMGKPAEYSETLVKRQAFLTGAYMAKEAYPGISQGGIITFARDFMDQAVGNYAAAQRPIMFQGTLGVAMGLFQTYMVTFAQDMYRLIENKNWKALAKTMLTQESIFGAKSLPGFDYVSEIIGEHYSDQNFDLTTGLYRALPHKMADMILYGLPSNLGVAVSTRGEVQPRIPNILGQGMGALPAVNILGQAMTAGNRIASAAFTGDASTGKAILEALSMQSVSRPIARISELFSGHSVTTKGNLVAGPDDIYTFAGVAARAMASRPLEEVKAREAIHLNTLYGSLDREAREKVTQSLRMHIRDNNLTPEIVEQLGIEYLKTGSAVGWRSAVNTALAQTAVPSHNTVRNYLKKDSPFLMMVEDLD